MATIAALIFMSDSAVFAQSNPDEVHPLEPGKPIERAIGPKGHHIYGVKLARGAVLRAFIDQRRTTLLAYVFGPGGRVGSFSSPTGPGDTIPVTVQAKLDGDYYLHIKLLNETNSGGGYTVRIEQILTGNSAAAWAAEQENKVSSNLQAVKSWLATNLVPIRTVEMGAGFEDMLPAKRMIGSARIVSLGEANHGTREFAQFKARMLEFLVSEMGFNAFAIEASMPEAFDINHYVLTGQGDPVQALAGLYFWISDTEEMLDTIQWIRRYNVDPTHVRKIKFYGFDMQYPARAARITLDYLRQVDPEQRLSSERVLAPLANPFTASDFRMWPSEARQELLASINQLLQRFRERKQSYVMASSRNDYAVALRHANVLAQNITLFGRGSTNSQAVTRDRFMAENVGWILEHEGPGTKIVLSAHNGHVSADPRAGTMGSYLRRMFGSNMAAVGFIADQGTFRAVEMGFPSLRGMSTFAVAPAPEGSLESVLRSTHHHLGLLDLAAVSNIPAVAEWFSMPHPTRVGGAAYSDDWERQAFKPSQVLKSYDALFFVGRTTAPHMLPGGERPGDQLLAAPSNLDFEKSDARQLPVDWVVPPGLGTFIYEVSVDGENRHSGKQSAVIRTIPGKHCNDAFGSLHQQLDPVPYRGKKIRFRAFVRTDVNGGGGQAHLWLRAWKPRNGSGIPGGFFANTANSPITANEWRAYEINGEVPADAVLIDYGFALVGEGRAWLDDVTLEFREK